MEEEKNNLYGSANHYLIKITRKKENPIKTVISVLSYALFIFLLLVGGTLLIYVADLKIKQAKGETATPKYNAYVVLTGSMIPQILVNDVVITKKVDLPELKIGDIITFVSSDTRFAGTIITHRIQQVFINPTTKEYSFETKGDSNNTVDFTHAKGSDVLGKVILKIPKLGYVQQFLATKGGWIIVILIPCLVILSYDIVKLFKVIFNKSQKRNKRLYVKS